MGQVQGTGRGTTGTDRTVPALMRSIATWVPRSGRRCAITPASSPMAIQAAYCAAVRKLTWRLKACSMPTAARGRATVVIESPTPLMVDAVQYRQNAEADRSSWTGPSAAPCSPR